MFLRLVRPLESATLFWRNIANVCNHQILFHRYTLIPTSVILGLGGSTLWSAKCTYLTISGNVQAAKEGKKGADVINQYFGVFFFLFQSSGVWGNLMSSLIFGQDTTTGRSRTLLCVGPAKLYNQDRDQLFDRCLMFIDKQIHQWGKKNHTF